jgi:hypothetical protein
MAKYMNCIVTHIFREGNQVVDLLANHGLSIVSLASWFVDPLLIMDCMNQNKLGRPWF